MSNRICYNPTSDDKKIATILGWEESTNKGNINPYAVATLRGMYDAQHPDKPIDVSNIEQAAKDIANYKKTLRKENAASFFSKGNVKSMHARQLATNFTAQERWDRINMICIMFSDILDGLSEKYPTLTRDQLLRGLGKDNTVLGGQFSIWEAVFRKIATEQAKHADNFYKEDENGIGLIKAEKLAKVLSNWTALVTLARYRMQELEGVKMGNTENYVDDSFYTDVLDDSFMERFNPEESTKEHWHESNDEKPAFASTSKETRRILGIQQIVSTVVNPDGTVSEIKETDDLGYPRFVNPVRAHQILLDGLRGVQSSSEMMARIYSMANGIDYVTKKPTGTGVQKWMKSLYDYLEKHPTKKALFLKDLRKNFQLMGQITTENPKSIVKKFKTGILNKIRDRLTPAFEMRTGSGVILGDKSVYDEKGMVDINNMKAAMQEIDSWLKPAEGSVLNTAKYWSKGGSYLQRRDFIVATSRNLGLEMTADMAESIMGNKADLQEYLKLLKDISTYGIQPVISKLKDKTVSYKTFRSQTSKLNAFNEKIGKLNKLITKYKEGLTYDSRVTVRDSNGNTKVLYSNISPNFMGDRLEKIAAFVKYNDKEGLKKWIEDNYLKSSFFRLNGKILNSWLEDLYNACNNPTIELKDSMVGRIAYMRMLGSSSMDFEDFTSKQHAIDILHEYWAPTMEKSSYKEAWYPVFILGDSGVQKYIKQRRFVTFSSKYKAEDKAQEDAELMDAYIDHWYNVYLQDRQYMNLAEATDKWMQENEYSTIGNLSSHKNRFTQLLFLNPDYKVQIVETDSKGREKLVEKKAGELYKITEDSTESEVKRVIKQYLLDSYKVWKKNLQDLGVLETYTDKQGKTQYKFIEQLASLGNIDDVLRDTYLNIKLATVQQLQFFSIDPGFYKDVKDMQKRYKEIHAPGSTLDITATDLEGNLVSDGFERCVYFDDIELNGDDIFFEFKQMLKNIFGENSEVYDSYIKQGASLTDGQGYRTLDSYRKVLIMAGEWDLEGVEEETYQKIKALRTKDNISEQDLRDIEKMAAVFKPIKPYMFTHEHITVSTDEHGNPLDEQIIPVQHKYAEAVIIPELMPEGSKLRDIAYWMENNDVDMVCSTTCVKVGSFGAAKIDHLNVSDNLGGEGGVVVSPKNNFYRNALNAALDKAYVHTLSYSDYRIQSNVPDHTYQSGLFATQIRKLIMGGVLKRDSNGRFYEKKDKDGNGYYEKYVDYNKVNLGGNVGKVSLTGKNLISFYNSLIVANILESYKQFSDIVNSKEKLSELLIQNAISSNENFDNIIANSIEEEDFVLALCEGGIEHDTAALLWSVFKKTVNKQRINGGSCVQVSALGIQDYSEDGGLHFIFDNKDNPNNLLYAECEIPFVFSYTDENGNEVDLNFDDYCNPDGTLKTKTIKYKNTDGTTELREVPLLDIDFPGMRDIVAYRIPTERAYSMLNLKAVRFTRSVQGGFIKVPVTFTKTAGFDFDIDKLYFIRKEFVVAKGQDMKVSTALGRTLGQNATEFSSEYNFDLTPMQNTRAARNNMLLHLIQQRLMDPETLDQRLTPGGFDNAKKTARFSRELFYGDLNGIYINGKINWSELDRRSKNKKTDPEPEYDYSDPMTIIRYNQQNQVASKLIGIFANQNTNNAFASLMYKFDLNVPISFAGHSYSDLLVPPKGVDVDRNLAEFLAASVDAVKDPVLNFMNLNTLTANSAGLLLRLGYTSLEVSMLLNQPIIREVCDWAFNNNLSLSESIIDIKGKYTNVERRGITNSEIESVNDDSNVSLDNLASNIVNYRINDGYSTRTDIAKQLAILDLLSDISTKADEVNQFIQSTKFTASNAVKSTFGGMYAQQMKVDNYVANQLSSDKKIFNIVLTESPYTDVLPVKNYERLLTMTDEQYMNEMLSNPFAYEQAMFDMNRKALLTFAKYYPYETSSYKNTRNFMRSLTRNKYIGGNTIDQIHRDIMVYTLSKQTYSEFNSNYTINMVVNGQSQKMTAREFYTEHFAEQVWRLVHDNPDLKKLPIFEHMVFSYRQVGDKEVMEMNIYDIGGVQSFQSDAITDSWAELLKTYPDIATGLFMYNFYKTGFDFTPVSFMNLAPTAVKLAIKVPSNDGVDRSYNDFIKDVMSGKINLLHYDNRTASENLRDFTTQFIINHINDKYLVYHANSSMAKNRIASLALEGGSPRSEFVLDITNISVDERRLFIIGQDKINKIDYFVPAIEIQGHLFIVDKKNPNFNGSTTGSVTYKLADMNNVGKFSKVYTSEDGNMAGEDENNRDTFKKISDMTKDELASEMATEIAKACDKYGVRDENGEKYTSEGLKIAYLGEDEEVLKAMVKDLRESCRENGVYMMNENGELLKGC